MNWIEDRKKRLNQYIDENRRRTAAEAERYRDKQADEPRPAEPEPRTVTISSAFTLGQLVRVRHDPEPNPGFVTGILIRPGAFSYEVTWCATRELTTHYDFELEAIPDDEAPI